MMGLMMGTINEYNNPSYIAPVVEDVVNKNTVSWLNCDIAHSILVYRGLYIIPEAVIIARNHSQIIHIVFPACGIL